MKTMKQTQVDTVDRSTETLGDLQPGDSATILSVGGEGMLRQHLLDMGVLPGARITLQKFAPMGDPMQVLVQDYTLTLRREDARHIEVVRTTGAPALLPDHEQDEAANLAPVMVCHETEHPGLGEEGPRYHKDAPAGTDAERNASANGNAPLSFALAGNQNCGKTTLFNQLTGANQHVGNFPGVTVERKQGSIRGHQNAIVTDLPGIYSLSPYTSEEVVSRQFILEEHPDGIINIVDATNIERNLYLTLQLMELGIPMVLALNMMDEVEGNGGSFRINEMESMMGIPVIPISAMKNEGVDELVKHALHVARYHEGPSRMDFCSPEEHGGAVHRCLHAIMHLVEDHAQRAGIPPRFAASKLVEGDALVEEALHLTQNEKETVEHILQQMEEERGMDRQAAMADMRYSYIRHLTAHTVVKPHETREHLRSRRIDRILTGRWTALPCFAIIMGLVFFLTFNVVGAWLQDLLQEGIDWFTAQSDATLTQWHIAPAVHSLIIDGVYGGVGTVLVFLPLIICLFFFLSMLEDSGYMARIAFVMDKLLRRLGLSGRSIVPLLIGFGCSVPSIMASRTLPSARDRKLTIMLTPFMSCTAKIPIYAVLSAAFFPRHAGWVMMGLYAMGILVGILVALGVKRTTLRGEAIPFVMELPNYRLPMARNVARLLWDKARDFIQRAFTVIFLSSIIIWFLQTFDFHLQMVDAAHADQSILAQLASLVSPLFAPLGCGDWRIVTSLVSGLLAKEVVVGTLGTLCGGEGISTVEAVRSVIPSQAAALALLVFCLLYTPCMAAVSTIRRELGTRWAVLISCGQSLIAWVVALVVKLIFSAF